jgi:hypothetical protein
MNDNMFIEGYTFNPTLKQIKFPDNVELRKESLIIITNVTSNVIIYQFTEPTLGGTINGQTLTLTYNTAAMAATDSLQIIYKETGRGNQDVVIHQLLDMIAAPDYVIPLSNGVRYMRSFIDSNSVIGTVTAVTTLANQTSIGGLPAQEMILDVWRNEERGLRDRIT